AIDRASRVDDGRSEVGGRELEFHPLDALAAGLAEEEPDHDVIEDTVDETIDDGPQPGLAAQLVVHASFGHREKLAKIFPPGRFWALFVQCGMAVETGGGRDRPKIGDGRTPVAGVRRQVKQAGFGVVGTKGYASRLPTRRAMAASAGMWA